MVLITGASSGIGEACAYRFAQDGYPLVLWARRKNKLIQVKNKCLKMGAPLVHVAEVDVKQKKKISSEIKKLPKVYKNISILINNAGLARGFDFIQNSNSMDWDEMIDVNIKGLLYVTEALLSAMIKLKNSHIVMMGSVAGHWSYPKGHAYCASKSAVRSLTESLRMDLLGTGVRVTEIAPGMVETEFSEVRFRDKQKAKQVYQGMTPLCAQDIAEAVLWSVCRPPHVNIQSLVIYPTDQASPTLVSRKNQ